MKKDTTLINFASPSSGSPQSCRP